MYSESVISKSEVRRAVIDCGLCYLRLINSDEIVSCEQGIHLFHVSCFNKQKMHAKQNICPRCGKGMTNDHDSGQFSM